MLVNLVEIYEDRKLSNESRSIGQPQKKQFLLREISINPAHLISAREDSLLNSGGALQHLFPEGLDSRQKFTKLCLQRGNYGWDVIVVGDLNQVREKLNINTKKMLLNG
jgi:hypothetical protein